MVTLRSRSHFGSNISPLICVIFFPVVVFSPDRAREVEKYWRRNGSRDHHEFLPYGMCRGLMTDMLWLADRFQRSWGSYGFSFVPHGVKCSTEEPYSHTHRQTNKKTPNLKVDLKMSFIDPSMLFSLIKKVITFPFHFTWILQIFPFSGILHVVDMTLENWPQTKESWQMVHWSFGERWELVDHTSQLELNDNVLKRSKGLTEREMWQRGNSERAMVI